MKKESFCKLKCCIFLAMTMAMLIMILTPLGSVAVDVFRMRTAMVNYDALERDGEIIALLLKKFRTENGEWPNSISNLQNEELSKQITASTLVQWQLSSAIDGSEYFFIYMYTGRGKEILIGRLNEEKGVLEWEITPND